MESNLWSDERRKKLETLFRQGKSFSLIATEIGVTRNAAIGKAHRMKLSGPKPIETLQRPRSAVRKKRERAAAKAVAVKKSKPVVVPDHDYRCTIYDLEDSSCRYPMWGISAPHPERFYCGVPEASAAAGFPYCEQHSVVCGSLRQL